VACHLYGPDAVRVSLASAPASAGAAVSAGTTGSPLVELRELKVHFPVRKGILQRVVNHVRAVDGVSFTIPRGGTLALVGESGCGKTTVGKALLQLVRPTAGSVLYKSNGQACDLTTLSRGQLKPFRRKMQLVFQDPYSSLNPRMMVGDLIKEGMRAHDLGANEKERDARVGELLHRMGLDPEMALRYPHEFSGGQRQRLAIARALAVDPEFIVLDEPTSALDASIQAQIVNLLKELQGERCLTYLFVTHNLGLVEYLADEVLVMYLGRFAEEGRVEDVFGNPLHPYTQALLAAVPRVQGSSGVEKIVLGGDVPSPMAPPPGCPFHPRCPKAMEICRKEYPHARRIGETHTVACHLGQA
jgi:peptide/nickel transport system ATP-binding protein